MTIAENQAVEQTAGQPNGLAEPHTPSGDRGNKRSGSVGVPVAPKRPRNTLWMAAGAVLVVVSGLAAASIFQSLSDRVDVLVATRTIAEGEVVSASDLRSASLGVASGVRAMSPDQANELVGLVATGPIGEGSIVHPSQFIDGNAEQQPKVIIGVALRPGQYPLIGLRPGDRVKVIEVSGSIGLVDEISTGPRELTEGEIVEVARLSGSDELLISLRVNEAIATPMSERANQDRLRLTLIDDGLLDDQVVPIDPGTPADPGQPSEIEQ